ncbi:MAG TPA: helix-turn-helix transcriptional regulator [Chloroflexota bacterium]|jgi:transcriptional regulator with XRE-family HTH domain|nr:helix-turn-helix transcriptional regulator [Chloroflexota bacterium]
MYGARLLRWARLHTGQSQAQLAAKTGIAQSTISRIESGRFDPHVSVLRRLLRACGYDLELRPARGYGVNRGQIRSCLAQTPAERLRTADVSANNLQSVRKAIRRRSA